MIISHIDQTQQTVINHFDIYDIILFQDHPVPRTQLVLAELLVHYHPAQLYMMRIASTWMSLLPTSETQPDSQWWSGYMVDHSLKVKAEKYPFILNSLRVAHIGVARVESNGNLSN